VTDIPLKALSTEFGWVLLVIPEARWPLSVIVSRVAYLHVSEPAISLPSTLNPREFTEIPLGFSAKRRTEPTGIVTLPSTVLIVDSTTIAVPDGRVTSCPAVSPFGKAPATQLLQLL
jgi:hypothetical protein